MLLFPCPLVPVSSIIIILLLESFSRQVFDWRSSDSMSPQVSRTLLSILADQNNDVAWIVSTHPLISMFSSLCTDPLVTVSSVPTTIDITVTFMFHSFFILKQGHSTYPSFCIFSFLLWFAGTTKFTILQVLFFFFFFFFGYYKVWSSGGN